ncbi:amp dependent CoA ligase [Crucibulum laeve]|uniref:Amp dependent CoA ligase n=1 Tax=Crucibulum laeve TaxID=68775 RepID=A0A5C3LV95_9AGAR|nr:amp dependent CoA ligase [Crucibulum laeve]
MTEFRSPYPLPAIPDDMSIPQFMFSSDFRKRPNRPTNVPFFIEDDTGRPIDFFQVHERTNGLANALSIKWNIGKDDIVCIFSPNHVDYAVAIWAVHTLGGVVTPANPGYTTDELSHQLRTTEARLIITHPSSLAIARSAALAVGMAIDRIVILNDNSHLPDSEASVDDLVEFGARKPVSYLVQRFKSGEARTRLAFLSFSSGTTGKPKAVAIPHYSVIANIIQMATHYRLHDPAWTDKRMNPGDIAIAVLPFFHIYGLVVIMHYLLFCGMSLVVVPKFNLADFLRSVVRHRVTHLYVVPPQIVLLCKHPSVKIYNFKHVKFCMSGAAPLSGELMKKMAEVLPNAVIGQGYGLTETSTSISNVSPDQKFGTIGSAGKLIPGVVARVIKHDGSFAAEGERGELMVSGPSIALGYYKNPEATKETFVDGWVHTGDEVIIKDLEVFIVDRIKEIIKVKGFQVAPAELEGHLLLHPAVIDACVVGIPDEYSGELPLAYVVLNPEVRQHSRDLKNASILKTAIAQHVSDSKVHYKWLRGGIEFIDVIPKNPSGKILRRVLRERARATKVISGDSGFEMRPKL